jgi:cytochrome c553
MKRRTILIGAALALGVGYFTYPLVDAYLAANAIEQRIERETQAIGREPILQIAEGCFGCHGDGGKSKSDIYPSIAGHPQNYVAEQLRAYADGSRSSPIMQPLSLSLSDAEIDSLSRWFAAQGGPATKLQSVPQALATCTACHGEGLEGSADPGNPAPRLAGQGAEYVRAQLLLFRSGERADPTGAMNTIAAGMADSDIGEAADALAKRDRR